MEPTNGSSQNCAQSVDQIHHKKCQPHRCIDEPSMNHMHLPKTTLHRMHFGQYRIVGNFRGRKLLHFGGNQIFAEETFVDCSLVSLPKNATPPILWRKLPRIATKPQNSRNVFSLKSFPLYGTMSHQLYWGDWEMGTTISCTECGQVAGLVQKVGRSSSKTPSFMQLSLCV